jgi:hypothetical protein
MLRILPLLGCVALLSGCQTARPLYFWGNYEATLYANFASPEKSTPEAQLAKLQEDLTKASAEDLPIPPGLHAHMGYLYAQMGQIEGAIQELETEKALFPESAAFMDRLIERLKGGHAP